VKKVQNCDANAKKGKKKSDGKAKRDAMGLGKSANANAKNRLFALLPILFASIIQVDL
jgi:hypothetical protein